LFGRIGMLLICPRVAASQDNRYSIDLRLKPLHGRASSEVQTASRMSAGI
jgi:hypothetical protein